VLVSVTDHAAERYRQRVRGTLDARTEIAARVSHAWAAGDVSREPPAGAAAQRGSVYVRDGDIVYVCLEDKPRGELVVVTLWQEGEDPRVPRRFTDALKRDDAPPAPAPAAEAPPAPPAQTVADAPDEDRNHRSYAPPELSSGDPLAG
jgi:hypothetical protein